MEYKMGLQEKYFNYMYRGTKRVEIRLFDDKRKELKVGDKVVFLKEPDRVKQIETTIIKLTNYKNFDDVFDEIPIELLASSDTDKEDYINDLELYYTKEEQEKNGVIAIEILKKEKSCGVITYKKIDNKIYILLVLHNKGHWGMPKGHVEDNETEIETAIREVKEETNIDVKIVGDFRQVITYSPRYNTIKDVVYFVEEALTDNIIYQKEELQTAYFIEIDEAIKLVSHEEERDVLKRALEYIK